MAPAIGNRAFELKPGEVSEALRIAERLRLHHRHRHAGVAAADARRSEGARARRRAEDQGGRSRAAEGDRARGAAQDRATSPPPPRPPGSRPRPPSSSSRGAALPDVGVSAAVDAAAFALPAGGVSDPIVTDTGAVIVKVLEKKSPTRRRAQDRPRRGEERAPQPAEAALLRRPTWPRRASG